MIRVASVVALVFYSLLTFRAMLVVTNFAFNQTEIAKTLCVKKDVPNNTCQGKCHLVKTLGETSDANAPTSEPRSERIWLVHLAHEIDGKCLEELISMPELNGFFFDLGRPMLYGPFRPPELS